MIARPRSAEATILPDPVVRYFAFAFPEGAVPARTAHVRWNGEFRMRPGAKWMPYSAVQDFTMHPPGFRWDARIRVMPLLRVHVRDTYDAGRASMRARIGGIFPVVDQAGMPGLAQSALARWIGEAVWFPMALLPGTGVHWTAVDDSSARVTVTDGDISAAAELHFDDSAAPIRMTALRYRNVDGMPVLTPFEGVYRDFTRINGVMVPMHAEVAWLLEQGRFAYWRGSPAVIHYQAADAARPRSS